MSQSRTSRWVAGPLAKSPWCRHGTAGALRRSGDQPMVPIRRLKSNDMCGDFSDFFLSGTWRKKPCNWKCSRTLSNDLQNNTAKTAVFEKRCKKPTQKHRIVEPAITVSHGYLECWNRYWYSDACDIAGDCGSQLVLCRIVTCVTCALEGRL